MSEIKVGQVWEDEHNYKVKVVGVGKENLAYRSIIDGRYGSRGCANFKNTFSILNDCCESLSDLEIVQKALVKSNRADHREASLDISSDGSWVVWNYIGSEAHQIALGDCVDNLIIWAKQTLGMEL